MIRTRYRFTLLALLLDTNILRMNLLARLRMNFEFEAHQLGKLLSFWLLTAWIWAESIRSVSAQLSARQDRIWPINGSNVVDLPQSSPFGPRLKISQDKRYDFHRGVDIPAPVGTPMYAIADGTVRINGTHDAFTDSVIQLKHTGWEEDPAIFYYSTYIHIVNSTVELGQSITQGDIIGYTFQSPTDGAFEHLHFEIRVGNLFQRNCENPWKYLPNSKNDYTNFDVQVSLIPNYKGKSCQAVVNISVPADQLTFNRVELTITSKTEITNYRHFDMHEANLNYSFDDLDLPDLNQIDPDLVISPQFFNSKSYERGERAGYGFEFRDLLSDGLGGGKVAAKACDVFGNCKTTTTKSFTCKVNYC